MRIITFLFLSVLGFNYLFAQTATLSGKITDVKKGPLPGVTIIADAKDSLHGNILGTVSDISGLYSLLLTEGKHVITFKMLGMKEKTVEVNLKERETKTLDIFLEESAKELGVVVVSAGKFEQKIEDVTVSMSVIKPSLVESKNTAKMDKFLGQIPSVNVIDGQANIRGGSGWSYGAGSRVLVLVDDLPMLTADAGDVKWDFLPVENLHQIEVIKGASSVLYGSSAMNGVINIRTAYPVDTPETRINVYAGVYDNRQTIITNDTTYNLNWNGKQLQKYSGFNFFHSHKIKNFDLVIGGAAYSDDGYRESEYYQNARFNANTRYRFKNIEGLSCGVNLNTMLVDENVFFIWQNDTTGAYRPLGGTGIGTTLSATTTYRTNIDPFITYADNNGNTHKIRTRYFRSNNINNTAQGSKADIYYGEYQCQKKFSDQLTATTGLVDTYSKVTSELYSNHNGNNIAAYLQADAHLNKFIFSLGGRIERNRIDSATDNFKPVFRAGVNYRLFEATHLRASYGQGYRYPSIGEKFISTKVGGATIFPNDSLKSENGYSAELGIMQGIQIGGWKGYFDVAAFYTEYHDMIEFTFSQWNAHPVFPDFGVGFKGLNIGNTRIQGLDISITGDGNIGPIHTIVIAGYTYMDPKVLTYDSIYIKAQHILDDSSLVNHNLYKAYLGSDSGNFLKYRFQHLVKADVELGFKKFSLGFSVQYNSFMENIDKLFIEPNLFGGLAPAITPGVGHYRMYHRTGDAVYDLRTAYQLTPTTKFSFIIKNLFNYIYMQRPADMQPPRTFAVQVTVAF